MSLETVERRNHGGDKNQQVDDYYGLMNLACYPRNSNRLTELVTPLKPLEAMARHVVCLASDVGGHRELIDDGETGFLYKAGDTTALADKVQEINMDLGKQENVRRAARSFVEKERTWKYSISRYTDVYSRLTKERV